MAIAGWGVSGGEAIEGLVARAAQEGGVGLGVAEELVEADGDRTVLACMFVGWYGDW